MHDFSVIVSRHDKLDGDFGVIAKFAIFTEAETAAIAISSHTSYPIYVHDTRMTPHALFVCEGGEGEFALSGAVRS